MKIIGIISSPHYNGSSAVVARQALKGAAEAGAEAEEIYLPNYKLEYCKGCFTCMSKGRCPINDDFEGLREKLYKADGIIISSPCYGLAPNAIMKNFLDRIGMYTVYTSALGGKYVAGISTAGAVGAKAVAKSHAGLVQGGIFKRGYATGILGVHIGWDSVEKHPKYLEAAYSLGRKMVEDIKLGRKYPIQNLFNRALNALIVKKVFINNIRENKSGSMKAVYDNLAERGIIQG